MFGTGIFGSEVFASEEASGTLRPATIPAGNPVPRVHRVPSPWAHVRITGRAEEVERVRNATVFVAPYPISKKKPLLHPVVTAGVEIEIKPLPKGITGVLQIKRASVRAGARLDVARVGVHAAPNLTPAIEVRAVQNPTDDELIAAFLASH